MDHDVSACGGYTRYAEALGDADGLTVTEGEREVPTGGETDGEGDSVRVPVTVAVGDTKRPATAEANRSHSPILTTVSVLDPRMLLMTRR